MDTYALAVRFLPEIADMKMKGVLVEAAQTGVSGSRFGWTPLYRSEELREEHLHEVEGLLRDAVRYTEAGEWPMRKSQCRFCGFKKVCGKEPSRREELLKADFKKRFWNPTEER
jgi:hypothetical protein